MVLFICNGADFIKQQSIFPSLKYRADLGGLADSVFTIN